MAQKAKTLEEIKEILTRVKFMDREFQIHEKGDGFLIQACYMEADVITGEMMLQKARKWYVSSFCTVSEVVRAAHKAAYCSMEHVVDEHFLYRGKRIFSPHYDVDRLAELSDDIRLDKRQ